jgi:hypothetical protein
MGMASPDYPVIHIVSPDINVIYRCGQPYRNDGRIQDTIANLVTKTNPGFADPVEGDFRLKPGATLSARIGFRPIPFGEVGLYDGGYR